MLLPIGDDNYGRRVTPLVVYAIVATNILMFIAQFTLGDAFTVAYAAIPFEITHGTDLTAPVRLDGVGQIPQAPGPTPIYLTLLTSMFLHGGFMHILGNMLFLWIFGDNIEDNFGHLKFAAFYFISGIVAALAQILFDPNSVIPTVGASGAIAGVMGAYIVMFPRNRVRALAFLGFLVTTIEVPAVVMLGIWIVTQFFSQFAAITQNTSQTRGGGVAYMAHIGGFIVGVLLSFLFRRRRPQPHRYDYN
jgi:membrane associated rhomboid family serine protease